METFNLITDSVWPIVGIIMILVVLYKDPKQFKFKISHITNFITLLILFFICRISWNDFMGYPPPTPFDPDFAGVFMVFLEDFAFVAPGVLLNKHLKKSKFVFILFWTIMTVWFGYEHRFYDVRWILLVSFLPYFMSRKWALRTTLGTVAICHILYDFSVILTTLFLRG